MSIGQILLGWVIVNAGILALIGVLGILGMFADRLTLVTLRWLNAPRVRAERAAAISRVIAESSALPVEGE